MCFPERYSLRLVSLPRPNRARDFSQVPPGRLETTQLSAERSSSLSISGRLAVTPTLRWGRKHYPWFRCPRLFQRRVNMGWKRAKPTERFENGFCTTSKKVQLFFSWERERSGRREPTIRTMHFSPYLTSPILISSHTHETVWHSPYFLYFCEFQKEICRALPDTEWTLCFCIICICSLCNVEVCKVPSAGQVEILQQTLHGKFGWNSWQPRAPYRLILQILNDTKPTSCFWPNQKTSFLL